MNPSSGYDTSLTSGDTRTCSATGDGITGTQTLTIPAGETSVITGPFITTTGTVTVDADLDITATNPGNVEWDADVVSVTVGNTASGASASLTLTKTGVSLTSSTFSLNRLTVKLRTPSTLSTKVFNFNTHTPSLYIIATQFPPSVILCKTQSWPQFTSQEASIWYG